MAQAALTRTKVNTQVTQPAPGPGSRPSAGPQKPGRPAKGPRVGVRMEGRLTGLEVLKAKTLAEVGRLTDEAGHARDDLAKPFAQAAKLAAARDRVRQIDEQLSEAAAAPRPAPEPPATTLPDWARVRNPDDPKWLAAAAMQDASIDPGLRLHAQGPHHGA